MTYADIKNRIAFFGDGDISAAFFSEANNYNVTVPAIAVTEPQKNALHVALEFIYNNSPIAKNMIDTFLATGKNIKIGASNSGSYAYYSTLSSFGEVIIDFDQVEALTQISTKGVLVDSDLISVLAHELSHTLMRLNDTLSPTDYQGENVAFTNTILNQLNLSEQLSYVGSTSHVGYELNKDYSNGQAIDKAVFVTAVGEGTNARMGGTLNWDTSLAGDSNDLVLGTSGQQIIKTGDGNDLLYGFGGSDTLNGGAGADYIDGGTGINDTVSYKDSNAGVTVNLSTGAASGGHATGDTIENIDSIQGSDYADTLTGDRGHNQLFGNKGSDKLYGAAGEDILYAQSDVDRSDTSTNELYGGEAADHLYGSAGIDLLDGGKGNDTMYGGDGDDTFIVEDSGDKVFELEGEGDDNIIAHSDFTLADGSYVETITAATTESLRQAVTDNVDLTGNELDNILIGNSQNNILKGGKGSDIIYGEKGNDRLEAGEGDVFEIFVVNGVGEGVGDYNILYGGANDDTLVGGDGIDYLYGGSDNDSLYAGNVNHHVWEDLGGNSFQVTGDDILFVDRGALYVTTPATAATLGTEYM